MKQIFINQFEKVGSDDMNQMQLAAAQSMQDDFLYRFFGTQASGVLGADLQVSYVSALSSSIAVGTGFFFDSAQTGNSPKFRMIKAATAIAVTHTAADATNPRIDRICLSPNFAVTATANRLVKTGGTGPITLTTVSKTKEMTYTLTVVAGTPGSSPSAPATPAGSISLATCLISANTGMSGAGAVTDTRQVFTLGISNSGHQFLTSTSIQGQLDNTDNAFATEFFVAVSGSTISLNITKATHGGRILNVDTSVSSSSQLNLPALSSNSGMLLRVNDVKGTFRTNPLLLAPNGSDKIMGVNANYSLEAAYGCWFLWGDSTNGWMLK